MGFVQAPNWAQHRRSPDTVSGKQLGTLRSWVSVTTVANPRSHLPYEAFHNTYGKHPCAAHDPDDGPIEPGEIFDEAHAAGPADVDRNDTGREDDAVSQREDREDFYIRSRTRIAHCIGITRVAPC